MSPHPFLDRETPRGYVVGELSSLLQKAIRRGEEQLALLAATELEAAGLGNYVFRRLRIIASEDVGLADPLAVVLVRALYESFAEAMKTKHEGDARLYLVQAVLALSRAPKSRIVDNAANLMYGWHRPPLEVPDWALDAHTARGRVMGRAVRTHYEQSYGVAQQPLYDPYLGPAHPWMEPERAERLAQPHDQPPKDDEPHLF